MASSSPSSSKPILQRIASEVVREEIAFTVDGRACVGLEGDTVLAAMLVQGERLRESDFGTSPRAGFCLMGACQDCWVQLEGGERVRACTTVLVPGLAVRTGLPR